MKKSLKIVLALALVATLIFACVACNIQDAKANYKKFVDKTIAVSENYNLQNAALEENETLVGNDYYIVDSKTSTCLFDVVIVKNTVTNKFGLFDLNNMSQLLPTEYDNITLFTDSNIIVSQYFQLRKTEVNGESSVETLGIYDAYRKAFVFPMSRQEDFPNVKPVIGKVVNGEIFSLVDIENVLYKSTANGKEVFSKDISYYGYKTVEIVGKNLIRFKFDNTSVGTKFCDYDINGNLLYSYVMDTRSSSYHEVIELSNGTVVEMMYNKLPRSETKKYDVLIDGDPYEYDVRVINPFKKKDETVKKDFVILIADDEEINEDYSLVMACPIEDGKLLTKATDALFLVVDNNLNVVHNLKNIIDIVNIADNIYLQVDIFGEFSIVKGNGSLIKKIGNFDVECSNNYVYYANENKDISFIDFQGKEIYVLDHKQYELISTDQGNNILVKTVKEVEGKFEYYTIDITSGAATKISNYQGVIDSMYYYIDEENNQKVYKLLNGIEVARFSEGTTRIFNGSNGGIYFKDGQTIYKISK